ncbi:MAG TPA: cation:proton antiporter [Fimbriimonadaceae bacterium]|nr:cation:proton antiporter [Fimbriimonadaceae bacterium]
MPDGWALLLDLMILLAAAVLLGLLFEKLRLSAVVGYLVAGTLAGPGVLGWVRGGEGVNALAELGVALLLFTIGLEFSFRRLLGLGRQALVGGPLQILSTLLVGAGGAMALGATWQVALIVGAIVSLSSTAVVLRVLKDHSDLDTAHGKSALGILLMQDVAVVPLVLLVTFVSGGSEKPKGLSWEAILIVAAILVIVGVLLPRLLSLRSVARNRELPVIFAIVSCVASTWAAHAAGLSPALGAFVAGMLLADSRFADQMRSDVMPLKTLFLTIFFASIGMLADLRWVWEHWWWVLTAAVAVLCVKSVLAYLSLRPFQPSIVAAIGGGVCVAQVGEFSFVLAGIAADAGALSPDLVQLTISVSVVTLLIAPVLVANAHNIARALAKRVVPARKLALGERFAARKEGLFGHFIIVGYGDAGQATSKALSEAGANVVVLEIHPHLVELAHRNGHQGRIGDATQYANLLAAGLPQAACLVLAVPDHNVARLTISIAKSHVPDVPVVARARYHTFADELDVAGADVIVDEEQLTGDRLGQEALLLGSPPAAVARQPA